MPCDPVARVVLEREESKAQLVPTASRYQLSPDITYNPQSVLIVMSTLRFMI